MTKQISRLRMEFKNAINISVDLETASTANNAAILSIGATLISVPLDSGVNVNAEFYAKATLVGQADTGFDVSKSTMEWWNLQDAAVREETFSGTEHVSKLLLTFSNWLSDVSNQGTYRINIFSNGANFDGVILRNAYDLIGMQVPFKFYGELCYRTMATIFDFPMPKPPVGEAHNALSDARQQGYNLGSLLLALEGIDLKSSEFMPEETNIGGLLQ
jgi:hypothetical protein